MQHSPSCAPLVLRSSAAAAAPEDRRVQGRRRVPHGEPHRHAPLHVPSPGAARCPPATPQLSCNAVSAWSCQQPPQTRISSWCVLLDEEQISIDDCCILCAGTHMVSVVAEQSCLIELMCRCLAPSCCATLWFRRRPPVPYLSRPCPQAPMATPARLLEALYKPC